MTVYQIPQGIDFDIALVLLNKYLRNPDGVIYDNELTSAPTAIEYYDALTAEEITTLQLIAEKSSANTDLDALPGWAAWSGQEASDYIVANILGGLSQAEIDAQIDAIQNLTQAKAILTIIGRNLITIRDILSLIAKMLVYIRDLVLGLRK